MAQKKVKKTSNPVLNFIIKVCFVVFLVYAAVTIIGTQVQIRDKMVQLDQLQVKIEAQEMKNEELRDLLENGIDDDYIAKIAREHGYAMEDERVYESAKG